MSKHTAVFLLFSSLICLIAVHFVQAQTDDDYKVEIMQHVIDPCFRYSAERSDLTEMWSVEEAVEMMKLLSPEAVQETIDVTLPVVQDKPLEARMKIYKFSLDLCIRGTGK